VGDYCKKLIDEVGAGGGFKLTTGCECLVNVKRENLRAMVETGRNYAGGPTTEAVRYYIGADAWTLNPKTGVNLCVQFAQDSRGKPFNK